MKKQHKTPCAECPWRRASAAGWLGASNPEEFAAVSKSATRMPCHLHVNYEDPEWEETVPDVPQCAGRAIFLKNSCTLPRDPELLEFVRSVEKSKDVFNWAHEFIAHHNSLHKLR